MKKIIFLYLILFFFLFTKGNAQCTLEKFTLVRRDTITSENYTLVAENGMIKNLNSNKYIVSLTFHENAYFAIFLIKGKKGWSAIDFNENILFEVYNIITHEPSPDFLIENRIRIIGKNKKIGFANECGKVIIKPKFDFATSFNNGYAIVGEKCSDSGVKCNRYGYIDKNGKIIKIGNYTYDQIQKEINWQNINLD